MPSMPTGLSGNVRFCREALEVVGPVD